MPDPSSSKMSNPKSAAKSEKSPAISAQSISPLKTYCIPLTLFSLFMVFQLVLLPSSFPPSHYDVLLVKRLSSIEDVEEAYQKFVSKWNSGAKLPSTDDFIKIRYAYELLTNPLWKRDYDLFGIDERQHVLENVRELNSGKTYSSVNLPLLDPAPDTHKNDLNFISFDDFKSILEDNKPILIQVYSNGSNLCKQFSGKWKKIAILLDEVANTGVVELGELELASQLAEKKSIGHPFFRNGLPSLIAIPQGCRASNCFVRYEGPFSVDAITNWFATDLLNLPRIPYYSKESLGPRFLARSSYHMVKVIFFSNTGIRVTPFVRQVAKKYKDYASFACVLWSEEQYSYWWATYDVEAAPATVFLKDPGTKPLVYYGSVNSSWFVNAMEENKLHELPQLRSRTSVELGCDARGYSRAGKNSNIWYCVILIGRPSPEMNQIREVLRRVQQMLLEKRDKDSAADVELEAPSANALKDKRLTFTWMDGEVQKNLCTFYLGAEVSLESCGSRRGIEDTPHIVMVRYMRNDSMDDVKDTKKSKSVLDYLKDDVDPASQLVARYNGSTESLQVIEWISKIIKDGDSANLPFYRTKTPELVPENADPLWFAGTEKFISTSRGLKQKLKSIVLGYHDLPSDPRIGPMLLMAALMSFGWIWLHRNQPNSSSGPKESQQTDSKEDIPKEWKDRKRNKQTGAAPPSMTDAEPRDAFQVPFSDSDSE